MPYRTIIYLLPDNPEIINIRRIPPPGVKPEMTVITRMTAPILIELVHNDTVVRQVDEDGVLHDIHLIHQIRTENTTSDTYQLEFSVAGSLVYFDTIHGGQEKIVDLSDNEQFEDWEVNSRLTGSAN